MSLVGVAIGVGVLSAGAAVYGADQQSKAIGNATNAQLTAAQLQENTQASMANAELGIQAPSRALGGLAQNELAYLMGLSPNLDVSTAFQTPQVNTNGTVSWGSAPGSTNPSADVAPTPGSTAATLGGNYPMGTPSSTLTFAPGGSAAGPFGSGIPTGFAPPGSTPAQPVTGGGNPPMMTANGVVPGGGFGVGGAHGTAVGPSAVQGGTVGPNGNPISPAAPSTTTNAPQPGLTPGGEASNGMGFGSLLTNPLSNPANLTINPDYQFVLGTNESILNNQLAASGHGAASTGTLDAAMNYATGLASTTYQSAFENAQTSNLNTFNELEALSGGGQAANAAAGGALESGAAGISGAQGAAGSAASAGAIGEGNAIASGIGSGIGALGTASSLYGLSQNPYFAANNPNYGFTPQDMSTIQTPLPPTMPAGGGYTYNTPGVPSG